MNKSGIEFIEKNYEIALLASLALYIVLPIYLGLFVVASVIAAGRGQFYKKRLEEFLETLSKDTKINSIDAGDATPITRSRNRKRRGSG